MWHWEILWEDADGNANGTTSTQGYPTEWQARKAYELGEEEIMHALAELGAEDILDIQMVFRHTHTGFLN